MPTLLLGAIFAALLFGGPLYAAAREKLDVVVLLDNSGSMLRENDGPGNDVRFTRLTAVQYLVEKMAPGDRIALVTFDSVVHTDPNASRLQDVAAPGMPGSFYAGVRNIAGNPRDSTNMADGLRRAAQILESANASPTPSERRRFIILLTDGTPNPARGENTPDRLIAWARGLRRQDIALHTVGLGELSAVPAEADAARRLLNQMAIQGGGAPHIAHTADDLPTLFGSIFAQLVGHEVSRPVAPGGQLQFTIAPGTHNLRVIATNDGAPPEMELSDPHGKPYSADTFPALLPERQTALLAADSINDPAPGTWTVHAVRGALEVAWEPNFEAVLRSPLPGSPAPSRAPLRLVADVRRKNSALPPTLPQGRAEAEYQREPNAPPVTVPLTPDPAVPNRFVGDLPDSGPAGAHDLVIRCFRQGDSGEEEGGPARVTLTVEDLPALTLDAPGPSALNTLGVPLSVAAHLQIAGKPLAPGDAKDLRVSAQITGRAISAPALLPPSPEGGYAGNILPGPPAGSATLTVTLSGRYAGRELAPQTVSVPLTLTPRPTVEITWPSTRKLSAGRDNAAPLSLRIRSSAGAATPLQFSLSGLPRAALAPESWSAPPGGPARSAPLRLQCRGVSPGRYPVTITARTTAPGVDIIGGEWRATVVVPTWLERNRWWLYPALGLTALGALLIAALVALWLREQARRRRAMLALLNGAAVYVPHTTQAFRPPQQTTLLRRSYTFGGEGADVFIPNPEHPGQPLFAEPRLRIAVAWGSSRGCLWRSGRPVLRVTPEGEQTLWYEPDGRMLTPPVTPTEGGATFRIAPENVLVRVSSEWTN